MSVILKLYNAAGGFIRELPDYKDLKLQGPKDEPGGWSFDYPIDKPGFVDLISDEDRTFTVTVNGTLLPFQGLIEEDSWDEIKPGDRFASLSGSDTSQLLDFGKVYPAGGLGTLPAEYTFNAQTPGYIVGTLMAQMQARGALSGITKNFTNTTDSSGAAWAKTFTITIKQGTSLLEVVQGFAAKNLFNWRMVGKQLQMYNPDTTLAADRTNVIFRRGINLQDAPRKRSRKDLKTVMLVEGDDGKTVERVDTAAVTARGRKEGYVSQGGTSDAGALNVIGDYHLQLYKQPRLSKSHNVKFSTGRMPWIDFFPGDYVYTDITGTNEKYRLVDFAMSVTGTESPILGELVLNDKFDELETQLQNKLDAFQSGIDKGGDSTPTKETPDVLAPSPPTGLQVNSDAYTDNAGILRALMYAGWNPPTTNSDGSQLFDLQDYEFWWRYGTGQSRRNVMRNPNYRKNNGVNNEVRRNRITNPQMRAAAATTVLRTNLATNPSAESATLNWPANNGTIHTHSLDTTVKRSGTQSVKSVPVTAGTQGYLMSMYNVGGGVFPVTAGDFITASVFVQHNAAATATVQMSISWLDASLAQVGSTLGTAITGVAADTAFGTRPWVNGQAPAGATQFRLGLTVLRSGNTLAGEAAWADDCLIEKVTAAGLYPAGFFYGASAAANGQTFAFTGTANASTSTASGVQLAGWSCSGQFPTRVDLGNGKFVGDFRGAFVNYQTPASVGVAGEFYSGKVMVAAIPGETPAGATIQVRIHDGTGYLTSPDASVTIPSDGSYVVIDTVGTAAATNTGPRLYLYSSYPFRVYTANMEKVPSANIPVLDFFDGTTPFKNLATGNSWGTLGGGTTVTPNVSFGGKKWTRIKHPNGGFGARMLVNLSDLLDNQAYTVSATVYNESDSAVLVDPQWCDITGTQYTLQPRETRRIYRTATRSTYTSVYRFADIEFASTFDGSILVTDVLIEYGTIVHSYYSGTSSSRDGLTASWVGSADSSESVLTGKLCTYSPLGSYGNMEGWQKSTSGGYNILSLDNVPSGTILGFDQGAGATDVTVNRWYAGRIRMRSVNGQDLSVKVGLSTYAAAFNNWLNGGVIVSLPASGEFVDVSLPAQFVAASGATSIRFLMYANGTFPAYGQIELEKAIVTEVAGAGYECSQYFDGSSPATPDFIYSWAGAKDDSFSDKTIKTTKDNSWRTKIVNDPTVFVSDVIPGALVDVQVRARDTHGHVSVWATGFGALDSDSYGPPAPSAPQLSSKLGVITVFWNGLGSSGEPMPPDFDRLEIHMSNASGFTPDTTTYQGFMQKSGAYVITGQTGGETRYFKFIAVDLSGNQSELSDEVSVVVNRIKGPDLEANSVTTNELAAGSVSAEKIGLGVFATNMVRDPSFEEDYEIGVASDPFFNYRAENYWRWRYEPIGAGEAVSKMTTGRARSGKRACSITTPAGGDTSIVSSPFKLTAGKTYQVTVYACSVGTQALLKVEAGYGGDPNDPGSVSLFNSITLTGDTDSWVSPPITTDPVNPDAFEVYSWSFTAAAGQEYAALRITNLFPAAASTLVIDDVSVVELGVGATEITAAGIRLFGTDGREIGAFVSNRPNYFSITDGDKTVASINQDGAISGQTLDIVGVDSDGDGIADSGFRVFGQEIGDLLSNSSKGIIAFGYRTTTPTTYTTTTEAPYQQVDGTMYAGRLYRIGAKGYLNGDTAGMRSLVKLRIRTDGNAAGITDTQLMTQRVTIPTANNSMPFTMMHHYAYAVGPPDGTSRDVSILLSYLSESAGGTRITASSTDSCELWFEDMGIYYGDVGIDRSGGSPPPTKKTYTTTWTSTSSATYQGGGSKRTDTSDVVQGYNSYNGNGKGLWIFPSMTATLAGATVSKVEIYAYANHWYYNSGGTARIALHGYTSAPASSPSLSYATQSTGWPKPGGRWVTLPSSTYAGFVSGAYRGFGMGPGPSNDLIYYGRFNGGTGAKIRITYIK